VTTHPNNRLPTSEPSAPSSAVLAGANQIPIGKFLASGAFGQVFRGTWGDTDVALKKIDFAHASDGLGLNPEEVTEALEWEVARLATTQHPNLVQFHGICHKDGAPYLVLEFCHQGSMRGVLERSDAHGKPIPASRPWQWMLEISQALAYLHEQGMLHRDLKAENILIDRHGRARLADLGVAQVDALLADNEASAVGQGLQDESFIAPENIGSDLKARRAARPPTSMRWAWCSGRGSAVARSPCHGTRCRSRTRA
jgi:serine/threonine protein kinase